MDVSDEWEQKYGRQFIEKIGVQPGDIVIDFGCSVGRYSIPIAQIVGEEGTVHSIDNDPDAIEILKKKIIKYNLDRVIQVIHADRIPDWIEEESVDCVLLYDVLHYLNREERGEIYRDLLPILKSVTGILSLHPKHTKDDDFPFWNFRNLSLKEVVMEVESYGFQYEEKIDALVFHRDNLEYSSIFNFTKKTA